jgi:hypothetical protein
MATTTMRTIYTFLIAGLAFVNAFGQTSGTFTPKVNNIPSSPEAALLGRFGDIPVGYYTGTANISIPLYTINESGVEIPITLSYHSSGIKVADEATWVGLGWSLEPGGAIIQEVRGKEDAYDNFYWPNHLGAVDQTEWNTFKGHWDGIGFRTPQTGTCLKNSQCSTITMIGCTSTSDPISILSSLLASNGQPDLYSYNLPGYSGKYLVDYETNGIVLVDKKQDIKIQGHTITTPDGNIFQFDANENTYASGAEMSGVTNKLTNITFLNGRTINFTYVTENYWNTVYNSSVVLNPGETEGVSTPTTVSNGISGTKKRLTQIETADTYIIFNPEARQDLQQGSGNNIQRLKSIDIVSKLTNKKIKSFQFTYSYFNSSSDYHSKRLRLESVKQIGYDNSEVANVSMPAHVFEYDTSTTMPAKESFAVDFWGYYNGQIGNTILIPDLKYFDYENNPLFMSVGYHTFSYNYTGANRYADNTKAGAYMLKKITYPTRGYTEFEYEPHTFSNQFLPTNQQILSSNQVITRTKNNTFTASGDYFQQFTLSETVTLHFHNDFSHGFPILTGGGNNPDTAIIGNIYNNSKILLSKTKNGVTTTIKQWLPSDKMTLPDFTTTGNIEWDEDVNVPYDAGATYTISVNFPTYTYTYPNGMSAKTNTTMRYYDNSIIDTSVSSQGGMRIKSIKSYTDTGNLASYKKINYYEGKLLNRFEPIVSIEAMYSHKGTSVGGPCVAPTNSLYMMRHSISSDDFGISGGNPIGYGKVEEVELADNGTDNVGKRVFYYINELNQIWRGMPFDPFLKNGLLLKEETTDKLSNKVVEKLYTYNTMSYEQHFGIRMLNHSYDNDDFPGFFGSSPLSIPAFDYKFSFALYPITCEWIVLTNLQTTEYLNGTALSTTQNYTYNTNGTMHKVTTTFANSEQESTTRYYAGELSGAPASETLMVTAGMTGIPVVTEQLKGTAPGEELLSRQKIEFAKDTSTGNHILTKYIYHNKGTAIATPQKRVTYDKYDSLGNLQQYTLENGTPVSFIWGYNNTMPIAKIENATYASITSSLITTAQTASNTGTEASLITALNAIRTALPNAMVTTYTFKPLVGVSTITDPKAYRINYYYDNFGRLIQVKDMDGKLLSENEYNYRP